MRRAILLVLVPVLLAGCGGGQFDDIREWMKAATKDLKGRVDPLPPMAASVPFDYAQFNQIAPFDVAKLTHGRKSLNSPDLNRPREALEAYDLDKLKMVGTLKRNGQLYGLIRTPEGNLYRVAPGNFVGLNYGRVLRISETEVELKESVQDIAGDWNDRKNSLYLDEQGQKS